MTETTLGPLLSTFLYLELQPLLLLGRGLYEQRRPLKTGGHGDGLYRTSQLLNLPDWTAILMLTFPCEQLFNEGTCQENWMLWLHDRIQTFQPVGKLIIHFGSIENYVMVHVVVLSMLWYVCVLDNNQMYLRVVGDCCSFFQCFVSADWRKLVILLLMRRLLPSSQKFLLCSGQCCYCCCRTLWLSWLKGMTERDGTGTGKRNWNNVFMFDWVSKAILALYPDLLPVKSLVSTACVRPCVVHLSCGRTFALQKQWLDAEV